MIFTKIDAKQFKNILHSDVERELCLLLDIVLAQKEDIFNNPQATDSDLREFKGQKVLISELKQNRTRLNDAVKREKESK